MSMGIGTNTQHADEGELKRRLEEVACGVWFTCKGAATPKMVKYQDEEGMIHSISPIQVLSKEKKYYCGIPIQEYRCRTVSGNQEYLFRLYYYMETNCWKLSWEE
ncbi:hypothetical protein [Lachnoclostridium sp. An138]|uniref:hypothetical protein n=1 Tax=Lachnoclostridium sp. An138 TaxID=1965560 RepID=UPI000B378DAD|nr:hypothetical protein [Lachnoclostridium sp. An138]OUQ14542.1 hypothetical protein B5E82_16855 [Lachnoclostridium sp. An138]